MKVLFIVGTQLRHKYFLSQIVRNFEITGVIFYARTLVQPPKISHSILSKEDIEFEKRHLSLLKQKELEYFSEDVVPISGDDYNILEVTSREELNSSDTIRWVTKINSDVVIDYGSGTLSADFLDALSKWRINLHGGLSPYYKGSATLLWPFYFQQPELAGITFHLLSKKIDGGEILQHFRPAMFPEDTVVDIGCRAIKDGALIGVKLLKKLAESGTLETFPQKSNGKLFLEKDYQPSHLRVVYDLMKGGMIKRYLSNKEKYDSLYEFIDQIGIKV